MKITGTTIQIEIPELTDRTLEGFIALARQHENEIQHLAGGVPEEYAGKLEGTAERWGAAAELGRLEQVRRAERTQKLRERVRADLSRHVRPSLRPKAQVAPTVTDVIS